MTSSDNATDLKTYHDCVVDMINALESFRVTGKHISDSLPGAIPEAQLAWVSELLERLRKRLDECKKLPHRGKTELASVCSNLKINAELAGHSGKDVHDLVIRVARWVHSRVLEKLHDEILLTSFGMLDQYSADTWQRVVTVLQKLSGKELGSIEEDVTRVYGSAVDHEEESDKDKRSRRRPSKWHNLKKVISAEDKKNTSDADIVSRYRQRYSTCAHRNQVDVAKIRQVRADKKRHGWNEG